mgnify:CR=1 FL=1
MHVGDHDATGALIDELSNPMQKDRPLVAYQQLSVEPQPDKDTDAILRFMATEYTNFAGW